MLLRHEGFRRLCRARDLLLDMREPPLTIHELARDVQISPFHLIRQFEAVFGLTPHQFRQASRLELAKHLLATGERSVTEVCMEVGFSSLGSFSVLFRRRMGETPSAYRRRMRPFISVPGIVSNRSDARMPDAHGPAACLGVCAGSQFPRSVAPCRSDTLWEQGGFMRIRLTSIMVDDQEKAFRFYTDVLGFKEKRDIPVGEYRWITVTSPEGPDDLELALEPNANPAGKAFQTAMFAQGIPVAAFEVDDIAGEFKRLTGHGVAFTTEPTPAGPITLAVFADTCGNLIQIYQRA